MLMILSQLFFSHEVYKKLQYLFAIYGQYFEVILRDLFLLLEMTLFLVIYLRRIIE